MKENKKEIIKKCPSCGLPVIKIIYGRPNSQLLEEAKEDKIILGGCIIEKNMSQYHCKKCNKSYQDIR